MEETKEKALEKLDCFILIEMYVLVRHDILLYKQVILIKTQELSYRQKEGS